MTHHIKIDLMFWEKIGCNHGKILNQPVEF